MPFQAVFAGTGSVVKSVFVVLSSMAPFVENRGSILLAAALDVKWYLAYVGTSIGSFLPVPFLLKTGEHGMRQLRRFSPAAKALDQVEAFSRQHEAFCSAMGLLPWLSSSRSLLQGSAAGPGCCCQICWAWTKSILRPQFWPVSSSPAFSPPRGLTACFLEFAA